MTEPCHQVLFIFLPFLLLLLVCSPVLAVQADISLKQNVTIDDSDVSAVFYAPSTSWRASTVPCSTCLNPPGSDATDGTWHDGSHIIKSIDPDDLGPNGGDANGTSTVGSKLASSQSMSSTTPSSSSSTVRPTSASSSSTSVPPSSSNEAGGNDDDDDDDDDENGKEKGKEDNDKRRRSLASRQDDNTNPFFTTGEDSDDPGFVDTPVTATIYFNGSAIYLFAIIPLFPAPPETNPTVMNLTFTLDGKSHGGFLNNPSSLNQSSSPQYASNFVVFSAEGLGNEEHSVVVTVGPDSVFLFDYALVTQNATNTGDNAPQRTSSPDITEPARHHDISTFVGAIGGSVGFLSLLSLGLCISIRIRRRRFARRERNLNQGYAEAFTADDHGGDRSGDDFGESLEGGGVSGAPPSRRARRQRAARAQPLMAQVPANAPFVPRYFPGSVPASPPPYIAAEADRMIVMPDGDALNLTPSGAITPLPPPPQFNAVATPPPMLDFFRSNTGSSYADRPPPTPPPEDEQPVTVFGERGMVTPPPVRTPQAEETDPMLVTRQVDEETASLRRSVRSMISSSALSASDVTTSNNGTSNRHTLLSVTSASSVSTPKSMPAGQLPSSNSTQSLISPQAISSAKMPLATAPEDTSKFPNLLGGPVSILGGRNDSSFNPSPSRVQSLPHLRQSASHATGSGTGAEDRMSLRSFSIDDHEGVGSS